MANLLVPPDIKAAAIERIEAYFDGAVLPDVDPKEWIIKAVADPPVAKITITTGYAPRAVVLDDTRLTVEVWHQDSTVAERAAARICGALNAWSGMTSDGIHIYACSCDHPIELNDPRTNFPRYLLIAAVTARLRLEI